MKQQVPHLAIVVALCVISILGYAVFSYWVVVFSNDATLIGNVAATWQNFAIGAMGFWIGSSSGGKAKDPETPTGKAVDPVHVVEEGK